MYRLQLFIFLTLSQTTNFRLFQMTISSLMKRKESSRKRLEIAVRKGEIARHEQFLLFSQCFSKDLYCRHVKTGSFVKRLTKVEFFCLVKS